MNPQGEEKGSGLAIFMNFHFNWKFQGCSCISHYWF